MRAVLASLLSATLLLVTAGPASAQSSTQTAQALDRAARALRSDPVYVDSEAERTDVNVDRLRQRIRDRGAAVFLAVLPASAAGEAGGDVNGIPQALGNRVGLAGTYGVVVGNSFRAASNVLPRGRAGALSTAAFQARSSQGTEAVLADFVDRVAAAQASVEPTGGGSQRPFDDGGSSGGGDGGGGSSALPVLLLVSAAGGGLFLWQRSRKQRREDALEEQAQRSVLRAELSVLAEDVTGLEPLVELHPEASADYEAGVARYRVAQAALERADEGIDLVRVERVVAEGRYAMARARALVEGREPPPPPEELTRVGRHNEPPVEVDERGEPSYVGYGSPFYGGGWFGGGGGLLAGLFLGQMLGGWGGGHHEQNVYVEDSGGDGGDAGGDWGGGDWGGGDIGGGDWGGGFGGDVGGGDWG